MKLELRPQLHSEYRSDPCNSNTREILKEFVCSMLMFATSDGLSLG